MKHLFKRKYHLRNVVSMLRVALNLTIEFKLVNIIEHGHISSETISFELSEHVVMN